MSHECIPQSSNVSNHFNDVFYSHVFVIVIKSLLPLIKPIVFWLRVHQIAFPFAQMVSPTSLPFLVTKSVSISFLISEKFLHPKNSAINSSQKRSSLQIVVYDLSRVQQIKCKYKNWARSMWTIHHAITATAYVRRYQFKWSTFLFRQSVISFCEWTVWFIGRRTFIMMCTFLFYSSTLASHTTFFIGLYLIRLLHWNGRQTLFHTHTLSLSLFLLQRV